MNSPKEQLQQLQEQHLQLLKTQQDAYLAGIKAWQAQVRAAAEAGASATQQAPAVGNNPAAQAASHPLFPSSEEMIEINRTYLEKIKQQQQEFLGKLSALNEQP
jgi:hypothetical protein